MTLIAQSVQAYADLAEAFGRSRGESLREAAERILARGGHTPVAIHAAAELVVSCGSGPKGHGAMIEAAALLRCVPVLPRKAVTA